MTKKNYETFARMLAGELALAKRKGTLKLGVVDAQMRIENVIRATADIFAKDNERFDRERFYTACGMEV